VPRFYFFLKKRKEAFEMKQKRIRRLNKEEEQVLIKYLQKKRGSFNGLALFNEGYPWYITPQGFIYSKKVDIEFVWDFISNQI